MLAQPNRHLIMLALHVAETISLQYRVLRPRAWLTFGASNAYCIALLRISEELVDVGIGFCRCESCYVAHAFSFLDIADKVNIIWFLLLVFLDL